MIRNDSIEYVWIRVTGSADWVSNPVSVSVDNGQTWVVASIDLSTVEDAVLASGANGQSAFIRVLFSDLGVVRANTALRFLVKIEDDPEIPILRAGSLAVY